MMPPNVPADAQAVPPGGHFPSEQAAYIAEIERELARSNALATINFQHEVATWLFNAARDRDNHLKIPPKPVAAFLQVLYTSGPPQEGSGIIWIWQRDGNPVGVCPDLPPLPVSPGPDHVHVERQIAMTGWWGSGLDDTCPDGYVTPHSVMADDGTTGIFLKDRHSAFGTGWWILQTSAPKKV